MKLSHVGIVVRNIEEALPCYTQGLGLRLERIQELPDQALRIAILPLDNGEIELLQPLDEATGIAKFLANRGEGIHHICFDTDDIRSGLAQADSAGLQLIDADPRPGAHGQIAFLHPKTMHGVLVELAQTE